MNSFCQLNAPHLCRLGSDRYRVLDSVQRPSHSFVASAELFCKSRIQPQGLLSLPRLCIRRSQWVSPTRFYNVTNPQNVSVPIKALRRNCVGLKLAVRRIATNRKGRQIFSPTAKCNASCDFCENRMKRHLPRIFKKRINHNAHFRQNTLPNGSCQLKSFALTIATL